MEILDNYNKGTFIFAKSFICKHFLKWRQRLNLISMSINMRKTFSKNKRKCLYFRKEIYVSYTYKLPFLFINIYFRP